MNEPCTRFGELKKWELAEFDDLSKSGREAGSETSVAVPISTLIPALQILAMVTELPASLGHRGLAELAEEETNSTSAIISHSSVRRAGLKTRTAASWATRPNQRCLINR